MNKKKLIFVPLLAITMFSCKKLIEIEETDFIDADVALQTVSQNEQAVVGAYSSFLPEMDIRASSTFSDEAKPGDFYASQSVHEWLFISNDIAIRDWYTATRNYYNVVDKVNRVLRALETATVVNPSDENLKKRVRGEALFLRAYCHFALFRYYSDNYNPTGLAMPYMETPSLETFGRIEMAPYFEKLERDAAEAKTLLPTTFTEVTRATSAAAAGLQARIALYKRDWTNAAAFATEFINAMPLASSAVFPDIWKDLSAAEVAFKVRKVNTNTNRIGDWFRGRFTKPVATGPFVAPSSISWVPSAKLWNTYDQANDVRFNAYMIDEPILQAAAGKPSRILKKYAGAAYNTADENVADIKVFRVAEMYLIRAEARAELGTFTGANSAESDINTLRTARINGYTNQTFASKEAAISAVMLERFKELAFEGHRFWDLKRRSLPIERLTEDAPNETSKTLPANNFRFVLPIPQSEILANPKMKQNPGYVD